MYINKLYRKNVPWVSKIKLKKKQNVTLSDG